MNKHLFWAGTIFQAVQLTFFCLIGLSNIDWGFIDLKFLFIGVLVIMNIASLIFMLIGSIKD